MVLWRFCLRSTGTLVTTLAPSATKEQQQSITTIVESCLYRTTVKIQQSQQKHVLGCKKIKNQKHIPFQTTSQHACNGSFRSASHAYSTKVSAGAFAVGQQLKFFPMAFGHGGRVVWAQREYDQNTPFPNPKRPRLEWVLWSSSSLWSTPLPITAESSKQERVPPSISSCWL